MHAWKKASAMERMWMWMTQYMVAIDWEGKRIVHWAKTEEEAREWMSGYGTDVLAMYGKRGKLIAARWTV